MPCCNIHWHAKCFLCIIHWYTLVCCAVLCCTVLRYHVLRGSCTLFCHMLSHCDILCGFGFWILYSIVFLACCKLLLFVMVCCTVSFCTKIVYINTLADTCTNTNVGIDADADADVGADAGASIVQYFDALYYAILCFTLLLSNMLACAIGCCVGLCVCVCSVVLAPWCCILWCYMGEICNVLLYHSVLYRIVLCWCCVSIWYHTTI